MKEVFVFGAGASHASAGTPLGKDLVWTYHQDCALFSLIGPDGKPTNDSIEEERGDFADLLVFLRSRPEFVKYANQFERNIKDGMISSFYVEKNYYIDELMNELQKEDNKESIRLIKRLTAKHITGSSRGIRNDLYEKFVQSLRGKTALEISIISFNFDCWLHEDFKNGIYFDYLLDFKTPRATYNKGNSFPLIKPNGSLDWAVDPRTREIYLFHWFIRPETYYFDYEERNNIVVPEPYIFLPHQAKDDVMKIIWDKAKAELRQATKIAIIGYSFPEYDKDVIGLFQSNIQSGVELEVVDLAPDLHAQNGIRNKYKKLFPNVANVKFDFGGFQGYMARELQGTR